MKKITETNNYNLPLNKKRKVMSIEELRACKGFENMSDEDSQSTINSLETLSILFFELFMKHKQKELSLASSKKSVEDLSSN